MSLKVKFRSLLVVILPVILIGCAVHYYDKKTGTEHIWGFGHMKMKISASNEGLQAVVHGTDVFGISIGKADNQTYFTAGWQRLEFIDVVKESTSVRLEYDLPKSSFVNFRVGSEYPFDVQDPDTEKQEQINSSSNTVKEVNP